MWTLQVQVCATTSCIVDVPQTIKVVELGLTHVVSMQWSVLCASTHGPHIGVPRPRQFTITMYAFLVELKLPIGISISPHGLLFSCLETFERLRSGDLEVDPCCRHKVVVLSSPDDVRIRSIGLFEWIREGSRIDKGGKRKHSCAQGLEELHDRRMMSAASNSRLVSYVFMCPFSFFEEAQFGIWPICGMMVDHKSPSRLAMQTEFFSP